MLSRLFRRSTGVPVFTGWATLSSTRRGQMIIQQGVILLVKFQGRIPGLRAYPHPRGWRRASAYRREAEAEPRLWSASSQPAAPSSSGFSLAMLAKAEKLQPVRLDLVSATLSPTYDIRFSILFLLAAEESTRPQPWQLACAGARKMRAMNDWQPMAGGHVGPAPALPASPVSVNRHQGQALHVGPGLIEDIQGSKHMLAEGDDLDDRPPGRGQPVAVASRRASHQQRGW